MIIKFYLIVAYLLLNISSGFLFSFYYLYIENSIQNIKEFLCVLFFPVYGIGNWQYNRNIRISKQGLLPRKYYILKYLFRLHIVFYVIIFGGSLYLFIDTMSMFLHTDRSVSNSSFGTEAISFLGNAFLSFSEYVIIAAFLTLQFFILLFLLIIPYAMLKKYKKEQKISFNKVI